MRDRSALPWPRDIWVKTARRLVTALVVLAAFLPVQVAGADDGVGELPPAEGAIAVAMLEPASNAPPAEPAPAISPLEVPVLALVNSARIGRGLPPLQWDETLTGAARAQAADMMRRGVVSHPGSDSSTPQDRLRRAGVQFRFGSENVWTYWEPTPEAGPATMHAAMMAEPLVPGLWNHIGNLLYGGYRPIGIGVVLAPNGVQYLSETFAD